MTKFVAQSLFCRYRRCDTWVTVGAQNRLVQVVIRTLVVVGVGMIMGDGVLTPAVSVVSAIEGLAVATPSFQKGDCAYPCSACYATHNCLRVCMLTN